VVVVSIEDVAANLGHSALLVLDMPGIQMAPVAAVVLHIDVVVAEEEAATDIAAGLGSPKLDRTLVVSRAVVATDCQQCPANYPLTSNNIQEAVVVVTEVVLLAPICAHTHRDYKWELFAEGHWTVGTAVAAPREDFEGVAIVTVGSQEELRYGMEHQMGCNSWELPLKQSVYS
jgi:hypothetical protein